MPPRYRGAKREKRHELHYRPGMNNVYYHAKLNRGNTFTIEICTKKNDYLPMTRYWCCDIKGAPTGKLQGKTVAIKDNTCVAGVPMMNGSRILEGFVPDIDATVVSRILDAGGRILGKAVCENLCCSGASFTAATGPVVNPDDKTRMAGGSSSGCAALVRRYRNHFNCNPRDPFSPRYFKGGS